MRMRRLFLVLSVLALCVPAFALADGSPHGRSLVGALTANPSGSVTVASATATLTCAVPDHAVTAVAKLALGGRFKITCHADGGSLTLVKLSRVAGHGDGTTATHGDGSTTPTPPPTTPPPTTPAPTTPPPTTPPPPPAAGGDHHGGDTPTTGGDGHNGTTTTTTSTAPPPPPPPPPPPAHRDGHGIVSALSATGVTLTLDGGGAPLSCAITPAPDSVAAAAKLTLGAHVGIVCRLDGTHYVLSGVTPIT